LNSIGIEKFRELVEEKFGTLSNDPGSIFNEKQRSLFGINTQKQNNLYFAGLHIPVGRLCVEDIQEIARLSEKYGQSEVRLTEDQNLIIVGLNDNILEEFGDEEIINKFKFFMTLESILMVVAPICLFTVGVIVLPILVKPRKQSGLPKRYIRGL